MLAALAPPTILAPGLNNAPGAYLATTTPTFDWNKVNSATGYGLYIRDTTTNTLIYNDDNGPLTGTSYQPMGTHFTAGDSFRWAMTSFNASVEGVQSSYLYFRMPSFLNGPTIIGPGSSSDTGVNVSSLTPQMSWTAVTGSSGYGLYISKSPYGQSNVVYSTTLGSGSSFSVPSGYLQNGVKYKWNMTTFNSAGAEGPVGNALYFQTALAAPTLTAPVNGATNISTAPTFKWSSVSGNHGYRLIVDTNASNLPTDSGSSTDPTAVVNATVGTDTTTYNAATLIAGTTYYWEVHALGDSSIGQVGVWSTPGTFGTSEPMTPHVTPFDSLPGAHAKLFLDFDGDGSTTWNGTSVPSIAPFDLDGDPTTFSSGENAAIWEIVSRVAEKYSPFNIDVTTVDPGSYDDLGTVHVVLDGDDSWFFNSTHVHQGGNAGSIGGFHTSDSNNVYVFYKNLAFGDPKQVAEAAAHEAGHSFGLFHQSEYQGSEQTQMYSDNDPSTVGTDYQAEPTAPIMGASYYATRGLWWYGTNAEGATSYQDDMAVIASAANGFGYRADDHGNAIGSADALTPSGTSWSGQGIIEHANDSDAFSFTSPGGTLTFAVNVATFGPMLDAREELRDSAGNLIASADTASLSETLTARVAAGTYYLIVRSNGNYGDVGQYTVSGSLAQAPLIEVDSPFGSAVASGQSTPINLGTASQYAPPTAMTFTIRNVGSLPLSVGSISLPAGFVLLSNPARPLDPGTMTTFAVGLDSSSAGSKSGTISFATNDPQSPTFAFPVSATVTAITGTNIYVKMDADHVHADLWVDAASPGQGTPTQLATLPSSAFQFAGRTGSNVLTVDFSGGVPLPAAGVIFDPGSGTTNLQVVGTAGDDRLMVGTTANFSSGSTSPIVISAGQLASIKFAGDSGGNDSIDLTGGSYTVNADTPTGTPNISVSVQPGSSATFASDQHLAGLSINGGSVVLGSPSVSTLKLTGPLSISGGGSLDLGHGQLLLSAATTSLAAARDFLAAAYDAGKWDGVGGVTSSLAALSSSTTSIAYLSGADAANSSLSPLLTDPNAVLLRPSLIGDFNVDGKVDRFDIRAFNARNSFNDGLTTHDWSDGDLTFDGKVDRFDIRAFNAGNNFNSGVTLVAPPATAAVPAVPTATPMVVVQPPAPPVTPVVPVRIASVARAATASPQVAAKTAARPAVAVRVLALPKISRWRRLARERLARAFSRRDL